MRRVVLACAVVLTTSVLAVVGGRASAPASAASPASAAASAGNGKGNAKGEVKAAATAMTFGVPRVVDPIHTYGEPDIKVAPNGDVHVSGPAGTGVQRSIWNVSVDGGDSWRVVNGVPSTPLNSTQLALAKATVGPGGGDTEIAIARSGKVFYNDLYTLTCFTAGTTSDRGATVSSNPLGCSTPLADRQWYGLFDPPPGVTSTSAYKGPTPLLYLSYNNLTTGAQLDQSTDGLTFTSDGTYADTSTNGIVDSNLVIDQQTGDVLALTSHTPSDPNREGLAIAVGVPDATGKPTFTYKTITDTIAGSTGILFPVVAEDSARNLYAAWAVDGDSNNDCSNPGTTQCFHVYYSFASAADGWTTWSAPVQVDAPPAQSEIMPAIAAGGPGIVNIAWYGTDQRINPSDQKNQAWDVYLAQLTSANSATPHIEQVKATPHPMHYNDICLLGTGCITATGNRNVADFFQVTIDNEGRVRIVYDDTSNGLLQPTFAPLPGFNGTLDHSGAPLVTVATQSTGINSLTGQPLAAGETATPITGVSDPTGDALFKALGGANVPGADITNVEMRLDGDTLHAKITVAGDGLGSAASTAGASAAQAVVRWQLGNTLFYAAVEEPSGGGTPVYYAGPTTSIDLCSVSACDPHYLIYAAPPAGGTAVTGTKGPAGTTAAAASSGRSGTVRAAAGGTTYDIAVPVSVVGNMTTDSLLEEVTGFVTVSATPAEVPITNAQADAEAVPVQVEGTRTFNFRAATANGAAPAAPAAATPAAAAAPSGNLPATGRSSSAPVAAGVAALVLALVIGSSRRRRRV